MTLAEAMFRSEWPKNDWEKTPWVHQRYLNLAAVAEAEIERLRAALKAIDPSWYEDDDPVNNLIRAALKDST